MKQSVAGKGRTPEQKAKAKRVALLVKRSAWGIYLEERKDPRLTTLVMNGDPTVSRLQVSHSEHESTVREVKGALDAAGVPWEFIPRRPEGFDASAFDLVITVGGDGTLLNTSHSVIHTPVLAINSAPSSSVGFFCGAQQGNAAEAIAAALEGKLKRTQLTRMSVRINAHLIAPRVLNDALFCHASPAATSRYLIRLDGIEEEHKSSGFWVGPAAGSTAAQHSAGGRVLPLSSKRLQLIVREPYTPHGEHYRLKHALVAPGQPLIVRSKMHDGKIFFDGPDNMVDISFGDVIEFATAEEPLVLLGLSQRRRWPERKRFAKGKL